MGRRALRDGAVAVPIGLLLLLGFGCSSLAFMQPPPSLHSCRPPRIRRAAGTRMAAESLGDFVGRLGRSLVGEGTFVRLTLSNSKPKEPQPSADASQPVYKLLARLIEGSGGSSGDASPSAPRVQVVYTHPTSTTTKTLPLAEAPASLVESLQASMASARFKASRLFTTEGDWVLEKNKAGLRLYKTKATFTSVEVGAHDRAKKRRLAMPGLLDGAEGEGEGEEEKRPRHGGGFLEAHGILDSRGQPKKGMRDKHRQIERFVEILEAQLLGLHETHEQGERQGAGPRRLRLLDAGCGRGLLTFAAYEYLTFSVRDFSGSIDSIN